MYQRQEIELSPSILSVCQQYVKSVPIVLNSKGVFQSDSTITSEVYGPVLKELFPWPWPYCNLTAIGTSKQIHGHTDPFTLTIRYHIPLLTNNECWNFHGGTWEQLQEGAVYTMDPTKFHGSVNWGTSTRIHLVIDK
jgi:hypothetical protein